MKRVMEVEVELTIYDYQMEKLEKLLPHWQEHVNKDGSKPFEDWTVEDLFKTIVQIGSIRMIDKKIEDEELLQSLSKKWSPKSLQ